MDKFDKYDEYVSPVLKKDSSSINQSFKSPGVIWWEAFEIPSQNYGL